MHRPYLDYRQQCMWHPALLSGRFGHTSHRRRSTTADWRQPLAELTKALDYGIVQIYLNGNPAVEPIDLFNDGVIRQVYQLGTHPLKAGNHLLTIEIKGANEQAI